MLKKSIALSPTKAQFSPLLFTGKLEEGIKKASELGFEGVELSIWNPEKLNNAHLAHLLKKYNLKVSALATGQSYYNEGLSLSSEKEEKRIACVNRLKKIIDLANYLCTQVIIGGIRGKFSKDEVVAQYQKDGAISSIRECAQYAKEKKVTLLIEPINRYETNFINTLREGVSFIKKLGLGNIKLLPDTFHMNIEEASLSGSLITAKDYLGYIHFADSNRQAPGCGHIDFGEIIKTLEKIGYEGFICAEILSAPDDDVALELTAKFFERFRKKSMRKCL